VSNKKARLCELARVAGRMKFFEVSDSDLSIIWSASLTAEKREIPKTTK
jgi:hypothetical protein